MNFEQYVHDLGVRIWNIVNDERKRNPDGDDVSVKADAEIGDVEASILATLIAVSEGETDDD